MRFKDKLRRLFGFQKRFAGSEKYWIQRYNSGKNSGSGSYNQLAEFKAEIINDFVTNYNITSIIEYGCGDGNQLMLAEYPSYIGFDVSQKALNLCQNLFFQDKSKTFSLIRDYKGERAQLTLSLDVVFHLVEDEIFHGYMERLFDSSDEYVIVYSSNTDDNAEDQCDHVKHRKFTSWVEKHRPEWKLIKYIPNRFPLKNGDKDSSFCDFYMYEKLMR